MQQLGLILMFSNYSKPLGVIRITITTVMYLANQENLQLLQSTGLALKTENVPFP